MGTRINSPWEGLRPRSGIADGLFDLLTMFFSRAGPDGAGIDQGDVGHLIDRHQGPVIIHLNVIEKADVSTAGTDLGQIVL